jgi:hypothetical protein
MDTPLTNFFCGHYGVQGSENLPSETQRGNRILPEGRTVKQYLTVADFYLKNQQVLGARW